MGKRFILFLFSLILFGGCTQKPLPVSDALTSENDINIPIEAQYFGSELPGVEPIRFAEEFLSGRYHSSPVYSPDGRNVWWAGDYSAATIYTSRFVDGGWSDPETVQFSEEINSYRDPFISPDGKRFYFISASPLPGEHSSGKENIWMMEKDGEGWSEPQPLPQEINLYGLHWTISVAENYNLYFSVEEAGNPNIYVSRYVNGAYQAAEPLPAEINSDGLEFTPNIAPDESYLLFSRLPDRNSSSFLYISYATDQGWSEAKRVENVPYCMSPIVTPDRRYVIFMGGPDSVWWRDTTFEEELRDE
jgi:Tol biopolymer transport system component